LEKGTIDMTIRFAVIGINHNHIFGQVNALLGGRDVRRLGLPALTRRCQKEALSGLRYPRPSLTFEKPTLMSLTQNGTNGHSRGDSTAATVGASSQWTHRWRKTDSNLWSHFQRGQRFRARHSISRSTAPATSVLISENDDFEFPAAKVTSLAKARASC
jgi:hypothetical protein